MRTVFAAVALLFSAAALAQRTESDLAEKPGRVFGSYYVYEAPETALPKPPRGYRPFYISHLGRHGARYALTHYDVVMAGLDTARALGLLSTRGEEFYSRYKAFYAVAGRHEGELTEKGAAQQRGIARRMFGRFPAVFRGKTSLVAVSTTVPRVVRSMEAFLSEMENLDRSISVKSESSIEHQRYIDPTERKNPGAYPRRDVAAAVKASNERFVSRMDWKGFAGRLFTSPEEFEKHFDKFSFELCAYRFVQSLPCLDEEYMGFDSLFTRRQLRNLFFADNYRSYVTDSGDIRSSGRNDPLRRFRHGRRPAVAPALLARFRTDAPSEPDGCERHGLCYGQSGCRRRPLEAFRHPHGLFSSACVLPEQAQSADTCNASAE